MFNARSLPGLPAYGPPALSFPKPNAFREGFVVEFVTDAGEAWVGNFAPYTQSVGSVHTELGPSSVLINAGGAGYTVDVNEKRLVRDVGFDLRHVWFDADQHAMIVSNGLWFEAFNASRMLWRSRRLSWDGFQNLHQEGWSLAGEAFNPINDDWEPFTLNVKTGEAEGGSYSGPSM